MWSARFAGPGARRSDGPGITSNPGSPLAAEADIPIEMVVGPEFVTGSSRMKSGTGQKMICNMITTATMIRLGRVRGNRMVNMLLSNDKLIDRGTRMVADELGIGYERARGLLLLHGSASKAIEAGHDGKMPEPGRPTCSFRQTRTDSGERRPSALCRTIVGGFRIGVLFAVRILTAIYAGLSHSDGSGSDFLALPAPLALFGRLRGERCRGRAGRAA